MGEQERNKWRSTKEYSLVYRALIDAARNRGTVTYQDIAGIMGLPPTGNYMGQQVGFMVGAISEDEVRLGRPMLSAIVVKTGRTKPGPGFWRFARELGRLQGEGKDVEERFWEKEKQAVYQTWQKSPGQQGQVLKLEQILVESSVGWRPVFRRNINAIDYCRKILLWRHYIQHPRHHRVGVAVPRPRFTDFS